MSQNPKPIETYANRVAQFQKQERQKAILASAPKVAKALDEQNPYLQARLKVLKGYGPERLKVIQECERMGTINTKEYDRFIFDILLAVGDIPTHTLRKNTEECGCFSCRGRKNK